MRGNVGPENWRIGLDIGELTNMFSVKLSDM